MIYEKLEQYRKRTAGFMRESLPCSGVFETNQNLRLKVNEEGKFLPFSGDTVSFDLNDDIKQYVGQIQTILYQNCRDMLATPIRQSSFHVTLHDLSSGTLESGLKNQMEKNRKAAEQILQNRERKKTSPLRVRTVSVFNMVNTSVVLGLEPEDEESCGRLMELYECFQKIVLLNYPLTLHITLGYYRPGKYPESHIKYLGGIFNDLNQKIRSGFCLNEEKLVYARFTDMNHYFCSAEEKSYGCVNKNIWKPQCDEEERQ